MWNPLSLVGSAGRGIGQASDWLSKMRPSAEGSPLAPPASPFAAAAQQGGAAGQGGFLEMILRSLGQGGLMPAKTSSGPVSEMAAPAAGPDAAASRTRQTALAGKFNQNLPTFQQVLAAINSGVPGPGTPGAPVDGAPPQMQMPPLHPMLLDPMNAALARRNTTVG